MIHAKGKNSWGLSSDSTVLWVIQHDGSPPIQTDAPTLIEDLGAKPWPDMRSASL